MSNLAPTATAETCLSEPTAVPTLEALPGQPNRDIEPAFDQHRALPALEVDGGRATILLGELSGVRSPARAFSPIVGADVVGEPGRGLVLPLDRGFEHALVLQLDRPGRGRGYTDRLDQAGRWLDEVSKRWDEALARLKRFVEE